MPKHPELEKKINKIVDNTYCSSKRIIKKGEATIVVDNHLGKDGEELTSIEVKFKDVEPALAQKVLDLMAPYFEDPYKQLEMPFEVIPMKQDAKGVNVL